MGLSLILGPGASPIRLGLLDFFLKSFFFLLHLQKINKNIFLKIIPLNAIWL
jgi:hypothetical protein